MFIYEKKLEFPVNIKHKNPKLAGLIISQFGGADCLWLYTFHGIKKVCLLANFLCIAFDIKPFSQLFYYIFLGSSYFLRTHIAFRFYGAVGKYIHSFNTYIFHYKSLFLFIYSRAGI